MVAMGVHGLARAALLLASLQLATFTDPECVIELECRECVPDGMPHVAGALRAGGGAALTLACRGGKFLAYPRRDTLRVTCEAGRYRVEHDGALRHLLDLGCQDEIFDDVLHDVEYCPPPYQGRAYQMQEARGTRHLATLCFDADRAVPRAARVWAGPAPLPPHAERAAPRSLLGNFNHMFDARTRSDAERLYSDEVRLNRRVRELLKHDAVSLADQELAAAHLLAPHYFDNQDMRAADFASNRVAVWRGPARGNLRHLHADIGAILHAARNSSAPLHVWAGTSGVMSLRAGAARAELFLKPGRFPVPRYIWSVVHAPRQRRAVALVLLNDPFVAVSEVRAAVFCDSACARAPWLRALLRNRNYESPVLGLVFCCAVRDAAAALPELPTAAFADVPGGVDGLLTDYTF